LRRDDVDFYVALAKRARGGPILEYGVGNGRIALPMARAGAQVVGVDHSAAMLADLRTKLAAEPVEVQRRVRLVRGDMRTIRLHRRFPLVVATFNTVLHLYSRRDVERFLGSVRGHLHARGRFVADFSMPRLDELARSPSQPFHAPRFRHPTAGYVVKNRERFDYDPVRQVLFVSMEFEPVGRPAESWMTPLAHRQFFPQEWAALLHYNGFRVRRVDGDFAGSPLTRDSDMAVWHAEALRPAARARRGRSA
jgi:SAM-dependent methyltransferase